MGKYLLSGVLAVVWMGDAATAHAQKHSGGGSGGGWKSGSSGYRSCSYTGQGRQGQSQAQTKQGQPRSVKTRQSGYYAGKNHNHWARRCWHSRYHCVVFYDAGADDWYYWCPPDNCYYPVSYCPYGTYSWQGDAYSTPPGGVSESDLRELGE